MVLAESGAIIDYIIAKHGGGRLALGPDHPDFAHYLYWLHFANGTLQPSMGRSMILSRLNLPADNPMLLAMKGRLDRALAHLEGRLDKADYLAGAEFTAADIIMVFSLTTMRLFIAARSRALSQHSQILAAHRQARGLPDGHAKRRPGHATHANLIEKLPPPNPRQPAPASSLPKILAL